MGPHLGATEEAQVARGASGDVEVAGADGEQLSPVEAGVDGIDDRLEDIDGGFQRSIRDWGVRRPAT